MASLVLNKKGKRRTRSSKSSTESTGSPDLKKAKNQDKSLTEDRSDSEDDDEVSIALDMAKELSDKMDDMLKKLSKLDSIEEVVNKIQTSLDKLEERTTKLEKVNATTKEDIKDLKLAMEFSDGNVKEINSQVTVLKSQLNIEKVSNAELKLEVKNLEARIEELNTKDLYLEAYSRRENIKFMNIEEEDDEDVEEVLRRFLDEKLGYDLHDEVEFQRVHRNPARKNPKRQHPRPILARFLRSKDCEAIMDRGWKLKNTNYQMFVDLPSELIKRRKAQMNTYRTAKASKIPAYFSKAEPDKLYVRGQLWPVGKMLIV